MRVFVGGMVAVCLSIVSVAGLAAEVGKGNAEKEKYTLRYKFHPGETLRWQVERRQMVRTTISGVTETTDMRSTSVKAWRVRNAQPDGTTTFEHRVDWIDMRQKLGGRDEVRYDSRTGGKPPSGFQDAARSVGVPLAIVKVDTTGKVLHREQRGPKPRVRPAATPDAVPRHDSWITLPLPERPVAVGERWSIPQDIEIPVEGGAVKKIKAVQQFVLEDVKTGVATIRFSTDILTPVVDPLVESQLVQREAVGRMRFDIDEGRILGQQIDIDKHTVGFHGGGSNLHYVDRFTEKWLPPEAVETAEKNRPVERD
jgi:hypothetical protein